MRSLFVCSLLLFFIAVQDSLATHIRAGEITAELVSCQGFTYLITITGYEDTESGIEFGEGVLDMDDGTVYELEPEADFETRQIIDGDKQIRVTVFQIEHTFPGVGQYNITYFEQNRNNLILNMAESVSTPFFIQTQVNIDPFFCNTTPVLTNPPIDGAVVGQTFTHNPGAYDHDGDSLAFKMVVPLQNLEEEVIDYTYPDEYDRERGSNPTPTRQDGSQPVFLDIDPLTGLVTWDAPANPGEYSIAFIIEEWRKIDGEWFFLGYVTRDMQIIVEDADNRRPRIEDLPDTCIVAGTMLDLSLEASDPDGDQLFFTAFGEAFDLLSSPATFSPGSQTLLSSPARGNLQWQTNCGQIRQAPYQMNIKVNDVPTTGPTLADFTNFNVRIIGPAPVFQRISYDNAGVSLQWQDYLCSQQAVRLTLFRKKGESNFTPDVCQTGLPGSLGFEQVAEFAPGLQAFRDTSIVAPGTTYCYRLLATFPDGSESLVSDEVCITIPSDAPYLTKVSVLQTDDSNGAIEINWSRPLNPEKMPENHTYTLLRGSGFSSSEPLEVIATGLSDTIYVDEGLNTEDEVYHYQIAVTTVNGELLATSATASCVRLSARAERGSVNLNWRAEVPWSNQVKEYPYHYIYRAVGQAPDIAEMELLDSVQVGQAGFSFLDQQLPETVGTQLQICYVVQTSGRYSKDLPLPAPLLNFSQRICVSPLDSIPPCPPTALTIENADIDECSNFLSGQACGFSGFENQLAWQVPDAECADDLAGFNIYFSADGTEPYEKIASLVEDNYYVDGPLASYAGCYRVAAVDLSGNESELSNPFCRDNCPSFGLPNVFTPNGDDSNDTFSTLQEPFCPRFLERVMLKVYNRWGKLVYTYDSEEHLNREDRLYNYWDGTADGRGLVSAGIYFYHAEVEFLVLDPSRKSRTYKGWVHVMYDNTVGR